MICTFFGHRNTPESIRPILRNVLIELIEKQGVDIFYVGSQGGFDVMVKSELKRLAEMYPHIKYFIVLAYSRREPNPDWFLTVAFPPDCVIGGNHTTVCSPPLPCRTKKRLDKNCTHRSAKNF